MTRLFSVRAAVCAAFLSVFCVSAASADSFGVGGNQFDIDFVTISGATNPGSEWGIVNHDYRMGVHEITNGQWDKFKSAYGAVAGSPGIAYGADATTWTGTNEPANQVSWYEAAQFVNWLNDSNGHHVAYKFTGTQGEGDYALDTWTAAEAAGGTNLYRHKDAFYYLPTEDEWVKAAYWNGTSRQTYATRPGDTLHQGNGQSGTGWNYTVNFPTDPPPPGPWDVGSGSEELNGTFDMMGNVSEWMENPYSDPTYGTDSDRGLRGGSYLSLYGTNFAYADRPITNTYPGDEDVFIGFRVASDVPEPTSLGLLAIGGLGALIRRRRS